MRARRNVYLSYAGDRAAAKEIANLLHHAHQDAGPGMASAAPQAAAAPKSKLKTPITPNLVSAKKGHLAAVNGTTSFLV
jgi:hypothetical protein